MVLQLQHMGKHVPLPLLATYWVFTLGKDCLNVGCVLVFYPHNRWGYSYWLWYYERRYRWVYSEVTPYITMNDTHRSWPVHIIGET